MQEKDIAEKMNNFKQLFYGDQTATLLAIKDEICLNKRFDLIPFVISIASEIQYCIVHTNKESYYVRKQAIIILQEDLIIQHSRNDIVSCCLEIIANEINIKEEYSKEELAFFKEVIIALSKCGLEDKNVENTIVKLFQSESNAELRTYYLDGLSLIEPKKYLEFFLNTLYSDKDEIVRQHIISPILWNNLYEGKISWLDDLEKYFTNDFINSMIHDKSVNIGTHFISLISSFSRNNVKKYEKILWDIIRNKKEEIKLRQNAASAIGKYAEGKTIIELQNISIKEFELSYSVGEANKTLEQRFHKSIDEIIKDVYNNEHGKSKRSPQNDIKRLEKDLIKLLKIGKEQSYFDMKEKFLLDNDALKAEMLKDILALVNSADKNDNYAYLVFGLEEEKQKIISVKNTENYPIIEQQITHLIVGYIHPKIDINPGEIPINQLYTWQQKGLISKEIPFSDSQKKPETNECIVAIQIKRQPKTVYELKKAFKTYYLKGTSWIRTTSQTDIILQPERERLMKT